MSEQAPLLGGTEADYESIESTSRYQRYRNAVAEQIEGRLFHLLVILLIAVDATCVLFDIGYSFLKEDGCDTPEEQLPFWLGVLSNISLGITTFLLVEIPLVIWSLGIDFYNPFGPVAHAGLHLFDAFIIVTTFLLEVILRGKEREVASLLIILRLWRLAKLVGGVAVGVGEVEEGNAKLLKQSRKDLKDLNQALFTAREENAQLRARLTQLEGSSM